MVLNRCDLEDKGEEGITSEGLEKASSELGFEDFLRCVMHTMKIILI